MSFVLTGLGGSAMRYVLDKMLVTAAGPVGVISGIKVGCHGGRAGFALHGTKQPVFILIRTGPERHLQSYKADGAKALSQEIRALCPGLLERFLEDSTGF